VLLVFLHGLATIYAENYMTFKVCFVSVHTAWYKCGFFHVLPCLSCTGMYWYVPELEIRTVRVLSRPYNQGTYGHCAIPIWHGTEATDCVTGAVQQQFHTDLNSALFSSRPTSWGILARPGRMIASLDTGRQQEF
jgi:hypothetical protein